MADRYTLSAPAHHEIEIRKSRFLAQAAPVADVDAAMQWIASVGDGSANHNCWAYRIGQAYRFNDDGEPSGTAGKPILQAIDGQAMDHVAVVVTRWFGGIKLGVGGLIRAYGGCAAECLRQAERTPIIATTRAQFSLGYAEMPLFKARTQGWTLQIDDEDFGASAVAVTITVADARLEELAHLLADLSRGNARLHKIN